MFIRMKNLDAELMLLGDKLWMARKSLRSNMSYAGHLAAVKTDKAKTKIKSKFNDIKSKKKDEVVKEAAEPTTTETTETTDEVKDINIDIDIHHKVDEDGNIIGMDIPVMSEETEERIIQYAPDFSAFQEGDNTVDLQPVTQADLDKAFEKDRQKDEEKIVQPVDKKDQKSKSSK